MQRTRMRRESLRPAMAIIALLALAGCATRNPETATCTIYVIGGSISHPQCAATPLTRPSLGDAEIGSVPLPATPVTCPPELGGPGAPPGTPPVQPFAGLHIRAKGPICLGAS